MLVLVYIGYMTAGTYVERITRGAGPPWPLLASTVKYYVSTIISINNFTQNDADIFGYIICSLCPVKARLLWFEADFVKRLYLWH